MSIECSCRETEVPLLFICVENRTKMSEGRNEVNDERSNRSNASSKQIASPYSEEEIIANTMRFVLDFLPVTMLASPISLTTLLPHYTYRHAIQ